MSLSTRSGRTFRIAADTPIVINRRATGCRPAVWYSSVAGLVQIAHHPVGQGRPCGSSRHDAGTRSAGRWSFHRARGHTR